MEILKKGGDLDEREINLKQTAQDLLDLWTEELNNFQPGIRVTADDKKNHLNRKLDKHLVLVINEKNNKFQNLPVDSWKQGETLRQVNVFDIPK